MAKFTKLALTALCTTMLFCACNEEWDAETLLQPETGELSLSKLSINLNEENVNYDDFIVRLVNRDSVINRWNVNELPSLINLETGNYSIEVISHDPITAEWDKPYYKGVKSFNINTETTTEIETIDCALASVGVTVSYESDLLSLINKNAIVSVSSVVDCSLDYTLDETRTGHLLLDEGNTTIVACFNGIVDGDSVTCAKVFTDITAGSKLDITYTSDDLINIDPGKAPSITSSTLNIYGVNIITEDIIAKVDINAPYGIENFNVKIISEQLTKEDLQNVGLDSEFDLVNPGNLEAPLTELGFPTGDMVRGKTEMQFDITMFMQMLALFPGTHQFELNIIDAKGLSVTKTLTFEAIPQVDPGKAPSITSSTLNIDDVNIITEDIIAKVDINAPYGIENFNVKIISEQLTKEDLQNVGLDSEFDLVNPGNLEAPLTELGFPTGDLVRGKTEMLFDITMFMQMLALFPGTHQFELNIIDAKGLSVTKTLTFKAEEQADPNTPVISSETLDINGVNTITADIIAKVDIAAPYGIENFLVEIISEQLTKEDLQNVGLDSEFDLVYPGDLEAPLTELGFPTGDLVRGKTEMQFDITMFMQMLALFPGTHQFKLTITDARGLTSIATLTFEAP